MQVQPGKTIVSKSLPKKAGENMPPKTSEAIPRWSLFAILALTGIIYLRALQNGITNIDDDYYIVNNPYLRDFSLHGVWQIFTKFNNFNYHPLTTLTNLVEYRLFELNPMPYHLVNVLLHLINTWLVFCLAERLSERKITALVCCLLFAVHPLHVESVAWIAERKDVLYALFYLALLIVYLRYIESGLQLCNYAYTLLLFTAALFSKSAAVTLPVLLLVIDAYKGRKFTTRSIVEKIPFFLLSLLFGALAIASQKSGGAISDISGTYSIANRIFVLATGLASYIVMLLLPVRLAAIHYFPNVDSGLLPWYYYCSVPFLATIGWLIVKKTGPRKDILFGVVFFFVAISVMLQIVPVGLALFAERYSYVSYIGFFYIAGQAVSNHIEGKYRGAIFWGGAVIIVLFSLQSWYRIGVWKDTESVFTDIIEKNPGNRNLCVLYNYWGSIKKLEGDSKDALELYATSISLDSNNVNAYMGRGSLYEQNGDLKAAIKDYTIAIRLQPATAKTYNKMGWVLFESGDTAAALRNYDHAILLDPQFAEAYNNRGWAQYQRGDMAAALTDFNKAISLEPKVVKPYFNRAALKASSGDLRGAINDYDSLLAYHPTDSMAFYNRGIIKINLKDTAGACTDWEKATEFGNRRALQLTKLYCVK